MNVIGKTIAGAVILLALAFGSHELMHPATQHRDLQHQESSVPWNTAGGRVGFVLATLTLGFGLTITAVRAPNKPLPVNSYSANVAVLDSDDSPVAIPLPTALAALLANYNGTGDAATNTQLEFYFTLIAGGAGVTDFLLAYNAEANGLTLTFTQPESPVAFSCFVKVAIPTTNNMP